MIERLWRDGVAGLKLETSRLPHEPGKLPDADTLDAETDLLAVEAFTDVCEAWAHVIHDMMCQGAGRPAFTMTVAFRVDPKHVTCDSALELVVAKESV